MRRRIHTIPGVTLCLAFLLALGEQAFGAGECPHHGAGAAHAGHTGHSGLAGHAEAPGSSHGPAHAEAGDGPDPGAPHGPCTCLGDCHGDAATPLAPHPAADAPRAHDRRSERDSPLAERRDHAPVPYSLPYATAPPAGR